MIGFVLSAVAISLSGVMAPGPITASALAAGSQRRDAGALIALGHMIVELPLILLLASGLGRQLASATVRAGIGLAGGVVLLGLGLQLLLSLRTAPAPVDPRASVERHPLITGIVLTAVNPYFLVWWATVGLTFTSQALQYGVLAMVLFVLLHWMCDLGWLSVLSWAGFKGTEVFGPQAQTVVSAVCGAVLLGFGVKFLGDAAVMLINLGRDSVV